MINGFFLTNSCVVFETFFFASLPNNSGSDDATSEHTEQINFHKLVLAKTNDRNDLESRV
jgi:hypothetical protein